MTKRPIPVIDGRGYIFDVDTLKLLREKYRLAGVLSGVLPQFPQQNIFNGLPLQLLPEEVRYLMESGEFYLVDDKQAHEKLETENEIDANAQIVTIPAQSKFTTECRDLEPVNFVEPTEERYNIFKYLVDRGYFIMPGLRFGCQFMAYPGDLMRYHSHYNTLGYNWDDKFDILDIVNGGRLATSVKKCWVVGAKEPETEEMQVFSIEWAGFG